MRFADTWNQQNREVTAIVHASSDPQRIGVVARRSQWIRESMSLEEFASFVDRTIAAAIDLFAELTPVTELPLVSRSAAVAAGRRLSLRYETGTRSLTVAKGARPSRCG